METKVSQRSPRIIVFSLWRISRYRVYWFLLYLIIYQQLYFNSFESYTYLLALKLTALRAKITQTTSDRLTRVLWNKNLIFTRLFHDIYYNYLCYLYIPLLSILLSKFISCFDNIIRHRHATWHLIARFTWQISNSLDFPTYYSPWQNVIATLPPTFHVVFSPCYLSSWLSSPNYV